MRKKPTGIISQAQVNLKGLETESIDFPEAKEEIEKFIADHYVEAAQGQGVNICLGSLNKTDDLDFECILDGITGYLELTEVALLEKSGYDKAKSTYNIYEFSKSVASKIKTKANKYKGSTNRPIVLLLYITDWKFAPSRQVIDLLEFCLRYGVHGLTKIDWYCPLVGGRGSLYTIYPSTRENWSGFSPGKLRGMFVAIADVTKPVVVNQEIQ